MSSSNTLVRKPCSFFASSESIPLNELHLLCRGFFERPDVTVKPIESRIVITFPYLKAMKTMNAIVKGTDIIFEKPHETLSMQEFDTFVKLKKRYGLMRRSPDELDTTFEGEDVVETPAPQFAKKQKRSCGPSDSQYLP